MNVLNEIESTVNQHLKTATQQNDAILVIILNFLKFSIKQAKLFYIFSQKVENSDTLNASDSIDSSVTKKSKKSKKFFEKKQVLDSPHKRPMPSAAEIHRLSELAAQNNQALFTQTIKKF